jgi:hypothetical protein
MSRNTSVNQPEVAEENSMTAAPDAFKYLGKGFDITKYDSFSDTSKAVLHHLMIAYDEYLDMEEITSTVQSKYAKTVHERNSEHHGWMLKLEAMVSFPVVDVQFQANWHNTLNIEKCFNYNVDELHTETVKFDMDKVNRSTESLAKKIRGIPFWIYYISLLQTFKENVLFRILRKILILRHPEHLTDDIKLNICRELLESEEVSGATHFISGVRLGARVTQLFLQEIAQTGKEKAISSNVAGKGLGIGVSFGSQQIAKYEEKKEYIIMQKGCDLRLIDNVGIPSTIPRNQAVAIGLELLPITDLVPLEWRDPLKRVCIERLNIEQMKKPAVPGKDRNAPYLLKAGNFWLKENKSRIEATVKLEEASHFYVIPNSNPPDSFYIQYRTSDNSLWYVLVDCKEKYDIKLEKGKESDKFLLEVVRVGYSKQAKLSDWSNEPLLIRRAKPGCIWNSTYYLSIDTAQHADALRVTSCKYPSSSERETKFAICNAPRCAMSMEK